jgi:glutamyl-tRNA synthetase
MPHILNEQGNKKLSKRDGAKDILDYFKQGFVEEAMLNFIASLGWNDGTTQELFSREDLLAKFSLDRVQKSGARFDEKRLEWMSGAWIRRLNLDELYERCQSYLPESANNFDNEYKKQVVGLAQERLKYFAELPDLTNFFFEDLPVNMDLIDGNKQLKKFDHAELKKLLEQAKSSLEQSDFSTQDLTERLNQLLETTGQKPGVLFSLIRVATTQAPFSPALADTLHVLGKERSLTRVDSQLSAL